MTGSPTDQLGFLIADSEIANRIAAYDWKSTSIGPIEDWPESLKQTIRLMLPSAVPLVVLWGEDGVMIYNDAYSEFAGGRDSVLLGSQVRQGWNEVAGFNDNVMRVGLAGKTLSYRNLELTLHRDGTPEQVWMNLDYSPIIGENGTPVGVLAIVIETTQAQKARQALEFSERKLRFLDELSRLLVNCHEAGEVLRITTEMTAKHLGAFNCAYADMDDDQDGFTIRGDWHVPGTPSITGHYQLVDFGKRAVEELGAGRPLIVEDIPAELAPEEARTFLSIGIKATICMPLTKQGRLAALMAIHSPEPRQWTEYDKSVLRDVTERSWAHIQRVGAEGSLEENRAYHRQIIDSAIDYGIVATDLDGHITVWNAGAAEMLHWSEEEMIGRPIGDIFTEEDRKAGRPHAKRIEALEFGRTHDARWHVRKSGDQFWGLSEMSPLRSSDGRPIGFVKLIQDQTREHEAQEALRHSEDRLKRAQTAGGVGLFSIDLATNIVSATPEFCRIFGLEEKAEVTAEILESLVLPEDAPAMSSTESRQSGATPLEVEYRIRRPDTGEIRIITRKADYERNDAGVPLRLVGAVQDATERRRIQQALELSEAQFSALAQNLPNQVWTANAKGSLEWFNDKVYEYCGAERGDLDGDKWMKLVHPDDLKVTFESWGASLRSRSIYESEFRLRNAKGEYRWFLARARPLIDKDGSITAWVGTNTDIDVQKRAQEANAQDRDRLWTISQDIMLICDFSGTIKAVNPSAERLLGWSDDEMIGKQLGDFLHPDDLESTANQVGDLGKGKATLAFVNRYRTKDGEYRLLDWTAVPGEGRIHAIGRDVTEQREVEEALRQSQKMEVVGQLTGGIAHDFNNLLQGITGSLDVLSNRIARGRTDDLNRWLDGARTSANRAAALTHRLLAFSRRQPLDPRPVKPNALVLSMEDMLRRTLGENVRLKLQLAGGLWQTRSDPNQLESAILNLAINARDAMPDGGALTIETCNADLDSPDIAQQRDVKPGQYLCICVTDTGTGMDEKTIEKAFEPFFTTKPVGQGTGLGLSMIYGFTRQSDGYTRIESEPGKGTTVKLYLPRFIGDSEDDESQQSLEEPPTADQGEVVLVVEDEQVVRELIVEVLEEFGYEAIEADDGRKGLEILNSSRRIDLLITDIGLPGMNGREMVEGARKARPNLKVLFMTGYAANAAMASGFLENGMAMITKPFAIEELASRIREIIEE